LNPPRPERIKLLFLLAVVSGFFFFAQLGLKGFWNHHTETQRAEVSREMVESGDWIVPRLNGVIFATKPPLGYWLMALSLKVRGQSDELAVRLSSALLAWLTVLAVCLIGVRLFGFWEGYMAGWILASSPLWIWYGRMASIDIPLACFSSLGLILCLPGIKTAHWHSLLAMICIGLAVLAKGPLGLWIPLLPLILATLGKNPALSWKWKKILLGTFVVLLIVTPWMWALSHRVPGMFLTLKHELLKNSLQVPSSNHKPFTYYCITLLGLTPLMLFLPQWIRDFFRHRVSPIRSGQKILWLALAVNIIIFCIGQQKKHYYFLPLAPMAALLGGTYLAQTLRESTTWINRPWNRGVYILLTTLFLLVGFVTIGASLRGMPTILVPSILTAVLLASLAGWGWMSLKRKRGGAIMPALFGMFLTAMGWNLWFLTPVSNQFRSRKTLLHEIKTVIKKDPLYLYQYPSYDAPFYLERVIPRAIHWQLPELAKGPRPTYLLLMKRQNETFDSTGFRTVLSRTYDSPLSSKSPREVILLSN